MHEIPVYLFVGFVGAGKTRFIGEIMADPDFLVRERTLLLICEEGAEHYDAARFVHEDVHICTVKAQSDVTTDFLQALEAAHAPKRIIIEYNGAWELPNIYNAMPAHWFIYQNVCIANAEAFAGFAAAMPQLTYDKLQDADTVLFNRCRPNTDTALLQRAVRRVNGEGEILLEDEAGKLTTCERPATHAHTHSHASDIKIADASYDLFKPL